MITAAEGQSNDDTHSEPEVDRFTAASEKTALEVQHECLKSKVIGSCIFA